LDDYPGLVLVLAVGGGLALEDPPAGERARWCWAADDFEAAHVAKVGLLALAGFERLVGVREEHSLPEGGRCRLVDVLIV